MAIARLVEPATVAPGRTRVRADLQGLRAIAVLLVMGGHYGLVGLDGGYGGVDVFFVVSGYLVTQQLLAEIERTGRVSLGGLLARRARRILPAASVVLLATLLASTLWLSLLDAAEVVHDAAWTAVFAANVRFAAVGTDYFTRDQATSPLQHYWSLAVEQQFFLVWPVVLIGCVLLARRLGLVGLGRLRLVAAVLVVATVTSLGYGVHASATDPTAAYFSTPARVWELGAGALVAVAVHAGLRLDRRWRTAATPVGLLAILTACLSFQESTQQHNAALLLPVLGAAAVLVSGAGEEPETATQRLLGVAALQRLGDWSYSLYLWHWPLLIVAQHRQLPGETVSAAEKLVLALLALLLAALTYRYVETPLRDRVRVPHSRALALYPASVAVVLVACLAADRLVEHRAAAGDDVAAVTVRSSGIRADPSVEVSRDHAVALVQASVYAAEHGAAVPGRLRPRRLGLSTAIAGVGECDYGPEGARPLCPRGDPAGDRTLVVVGDSHAQMWISAFERIARREGYTAYYLVKPLCTAADVVVGTSTEEPWSECSDFRSWALDQVARLRPDLTVVASKGPGLVLDEAGQPVDAGLRDERLVAGWTRTLSTLEGLSGQVRLLRDVPLAEGDVLPSQCVTRGDTDLGDCLFSPDPANEDDADGSEAAAATVGVPVVDPRPWLCSEGRCAAVVGDLVPYIDRGHLTAAYVATLARPLGRSLGIGAPG